jgi:hypothetical protein
VLDALRAGNFFVTSGEVLLHDYGIQGTGDKRAFVADVDWTWPAEFVELVWGDGKTTAAKSYPQLRWRRSPAIATVSRSMPPARNGYVSPRGIRRAMEHSRSQCIYSKLRQIDYGLPGRSPTQPWAFVHEAPGFRDFGLPQRLRWPWLR